MAELITDKETLKKRKPAGFSKHMQGKTKPRQKRKRKQYR